MNIALWIIQALLAIMFIMAGYQHGFQFEKAVQQLKWPAAVPKGLLTFIGIAEILGGIGLILPALTGILAWLTPAAAVGLALIMLFAIFFHLGRREFPNSAINLVLLLLAAFVAYGRFFLV